MEIVLDTFSGIPSLKTSLLLHMQTTYEIKKIKGDIYDYGTEEKGAWFT